MFVILAASGLLAAAQAGPVPGTGIIVDTDKTMAGQALALPPAPYRVVSTRVELAAGAAVPTHMHIWARYVYIERGEVELTLLDSGRTRTFRTGEVIVEPIGKWHSGRIVSDTVLVSVEQVPPGRCNTVRPPETGKSNDC
ncbi:MAG TPA: cupin domain-containing protein [Allosphingosinicella sp.]|jgi:quercetin dioxygenase-like cupin family protein